MLFDRGHWTLVNSLFCTIFTEMKNRYNGLINGLTIDWCYKPSPAVTLRITWWSWCLVGMATQTRQPGKSIVSTSVGRQADSRDVVAGGRCEKCLLGAGVSWYSRLIPRQDVLAHSGETEPRLRLTNASYSENHFRNAITDYRLIDEYKSHMNKSKQNKSKIYRKINETV